MFNLENIPKIVVKEFSYKDIDIVLSKNMPKNYILYNKGTQWMAYDQYTNKEIKEMYSSYDMAYGDVLITGFGFGILACWLASKPEVKSVTVLEISQDIYDIFIMSNKLPDKVNVIIDDASTYKTDKHYDCVLLDHYEHQLTDWVYRDMKRIADNIPNHDLLWAWSLEPKYVETMFKIDKSLLDGNHLWFNYIDFHSRYQIFKNDIIPIKTFPDITKEKFNEYIYTYFDRIGYSNL